jgi:Glucodextranase, domain B
MRNVSRNTRSSQDSFPKSALIISFLLLAFLGWRFFFHQEVEVSASEYLIVDSGTGSTVSLFMTNISKKTISTEEKLYTNDSKIQVQEWEAIFHTDDKGITGYLSTRWELAYKGKLENQETIELITGTAWFDSQEGKSMIEMKNIVVSLSAETTVIAIQNDRGSTIYVLQWTTEVSVWTTKTTVSSGRKLTILNSEVKAPDLNLSDKVETIDATIRSDEFFQRHGGEELLKNITLIPTSTWSGTIISSSGGTSSAGTIIRWEAIKITTPEDESTVSKTTFDIAGTIGNSSIVKVTINNKDASVSPVDGTFIYKDFRVEENINDITYKAYDINGTLLEKWNITVYSSNKTQTPDQKPTVTSYPINDAQFRIVAPTENPYKTTDDIVRIQGGLPANVVKFITVNDFRLTKFVPYSTEWYYFANKDYSTMNEGINLYTIRYYDSSDKLISERLFTIVKEKIEAEPIQ